MLQISRQNNFNLIRLVAALQVMLVHSLNHLNFEGPLLSLLRATPGVPIFFVISGFLIGTSYLRTHQRGLAVFFSNRALRIYPGLIGCVVLTTVAVGSTGYFEAHNVTYDQVLIWVMGQSSILQFYNPQFMRNFGVGVLNGALWTITVELQFYLIVPLLFALITRWRSIFLCLFLISLASNFLVHHVTSPDAMLTKLLRISFLPWIYMFMMGFILAWKAAWLERILRLHWFLLFVGYVFAMVFIGDFKMNAENSINPIAFVFLGCLVLKIAHSNFGFSSPFGRIPNETDISYGLYLYHMPIINLLIYLGGVSALFSIPIVVITSVCVAALSWYLIEKPALSYKR